MERVKKLEGLTGHYIGLISDVLTIYVLVLVLGIIRIGCILT
jgi:hypothetical protein